MHQRLLVKAIAFVAASGALLFGSYGSPAPVLSAATNHTAVSYNASPTCDDPLAPAPGDQWVYVSNSGSLSGKGGSSDPFATLGQAQQWVEANNADMVGNIIVCVEPGFYRLTAPISLGSTDSGTNGFKIVWTSSASDPATIAGSYRATGWTPYGKSSNIWVAAVPKGLETRQIYVNGDRATLASGAVRGTIIRTKTGYKMYPNPLAGWPDASHVDFDYLGQLGLWTDAICPVASVKGATITMAEPCWRNSTQRANNFVGWGNLSRPTWMENAFELLGKPGQFYLDSKKGLLYYVPRPGEDLSTADVEMPYLEALISGVGTAQAPIHDVVFSNLQFAYATWMRPSQPDGFSEIQANYTITGPLGYRTEGLCQYAHHGTCPYGAWTQTPGNVYFTYDQRIDFQNDRFVHLGAAAVDLDNGSQDDSVTGSVFTDISGNGVEIGNMDMPQAKGTSQTTGVTVTDNHLYGFPVEYQGGCPIVVGYAANTLIAHNLLENVPYSGISLGWAGWPDKYGHPSVVNYSHNNTVSSNVVRNFMQLLSDGGGIYTQGITGHSWSSGEHIENNIVHDELDWSRALQSDDGAAWVTYSGNVLYDNDYDWGVTHKNFNTRDGTFDPTLIEGNYWQQGDPATNKSSAKKMFIERDNTVISGPDDAPATIVDNAGVEPPYQSILSWQPSASAVPSSPERLTVMYAFNGSAYLTWRPGFAQGSTPLTSYTVRACLIDSSSYSGGCGKAVGDPVTISAGDFDSKGYVVIPGLENKDTYSFTVTENNANGSSTPSVASDPVTVAPGEPHLPTKPNGLVVKPGPDALSVQWYAPSSARAHYTHFSSQPILSYVVTVMSAGQVIQTETASSLEQAITTNGGSKTIFMVTGLTAGQAYTVSVVGVTPAGSGLPNIIKKPVVPFALPSGQ